MIFAGSSPAGCSHETRKSTLALVPPLFIILMISGCGDRNAGGERAKPAAKLDGDPISAHRVEIEMAKLAPLPPARSQDAANQILKALIDQKLLARQAIQEKLDQDAEIREKLEAARQRILAEAHIERLTNNVDKPAEKAVQAYFDQHPELFSQRRLYKLQELVIGTTPANIDQVRTQVQGAKNLPDLASGLQARGIPVQGRQMVKAAEDLPEDMLRKLHTLKDGQSFLLDTGGKLSFVVLVESESRPIPLEQARPVIERYLLNIGKRNRVETELKQLREQSKIEYVPPYAAVH